MQFLRALTAAGAAAALLATPARTAAPAARPWPGGDVVVGYRAASDLRAALAGRPARIVRRLPQLRAVELRPARDPAGFSASLRGAPGIAYAEPLVPRSRETEPALVKASVPGGSYEWQFAATHEDLVPASVSQAASAITIAVVDTGADLSAPDLAAKTPTAYSVITSTGDVTDGNGHGTFVAALAAGSPSNGDGIAGFGGEARLLVVQSGSSSGEFSDLDEASGIVWAVDHGARIVNLSVGGPDTSETEQNAIQYAADHGVLVVAAAGNDYNTGNPVEYPAALLQPPDSNGQGGIGLSVGASDYGGAWSGFSSTGSWISLAAPGVQVFSALSSTPGADQDFSPVSLPGATAGVYGYGSGTSFAAPEVAGAAALVWAANPSLTASQVAGILKQTASGKGIWSEQLGYGVIDVAAAVAAAAPGATAPAAPAAPRVALTGRRAGAKVTLTWSGEGASAFRVSQSRDGGAAQVVIPSTTRTSAAFTLTLGHRYVFTVEAIDATGASVAKAPPYTVALPKAASVLTLVSRRLVDGRTAVSARLSSKVAGVLLADRTLVLQSFAGGAWRRASTALADSAGRTSWQLTVPGLYRLRVRYFGGEDLAPVTSKPLAIRVPQPAG